MKGGHSGIQIVCQRANANKLLFRLLRQESLSYGLELASVDGGGLRNAIPREATAVVVMREENAPMFEANVRSFEAVVRREFAQVEDSISITAERVECPTAVIPRKTASDLVRAVCGCPNGVIYMSKSMEGLVQTSSNLARVVSDGSTIRIQCLLRSSVDTQKAELAGAIASVFELAGAEVRMEGAYSGWNPDMSSPILHTMIASYEALYGVKPSVTAIHAGFGVRHHRREVSRHGYDLVRPDDLLPPLARREGRHSIGGQVLRFPAAYASQRTVEIDGYES